MHCEDVQELLGNYIDEELTVAMRLRIESHLAGCPACAGDLASLHAAVAHLQSAPAPESPNAWHFERLLDRLARDHDTPIPSGVPALHPKSQLSLNITTDEEDR